MENMRKERRTVRLTVSLTPSNLQRIKDKVSEIPEMTVSAYTRISLDEKLKRELAFTL